MTQSHGATPHLTCISPINPLFSSDYSNYLLYYTERLSRLLVMVDTPCNPLRYMIIPRVASSPMLLKAVCAVSACHLSQQQGSTSTAEDGTFALSNYAHALRDLTQCLTRFSQVDQRTVDQIVLTAVFLCKYEIIRGSIHEWRHHLTGLLHLIEHPVTLSGLSLEAKRFVHSLYVFSTTYFYSLSVRDLF